MLNLLSDAQFGVDPIKVDNFWAFLNANASGVGFFLFFAMIIFGIFVFPTIWGTFHDWLMKDKKS